jgi:uncharacterized membrane protein YeiH
LNPIYALDLIGTFAFALSGALVAHKQGFDLFGVVIIAFVTAVGGGMVRDVLIVSHPINWIGNLAYIWVILGAVVCVFLFKSKVAPLSKTLFLFDAIGISVFTLLGLQKSIDAELPLFVALIMGMVSSVFGGVIRDVLTREVPLIFKKEIYASACLIGGLVYLVFHYFEYTGAIQFAVSASVIFLVRIISVVYHLELPKINKDVFGK